MATAHRIRFRTDSKANWELINPILSRGEPSVEAETGRMKIGDGIRQWTALNYSSSSNDGVENQVGPAGPAGPPGLPGLPGPAGPPGASGNTYVHHQTTPASVWIINHELGTRPAVILFDTDPPLEPVFADLYYTSTDSVTVEWPKPTSGWAYL